MFVGCATKVLEVTSARPSMPVCSKLTVIMSAAAVERLSALVSAHRSKWGQLSGAASGKGGKLPPMGGRPKIMCVLSSSWYFFVSHDKYIARPSSKEPR